MSVASDQNGRIVRHNVRREAGGWAATVWAGGGAGSIAHSIRRYVYDTRTAARTADITDAIGRRGRIA